MKEVVFVVGMHRSGTSMFANIIANLGYLPGLEPIEGSSENLFGFYEDEEVIKINDEILLSKGSNIWDVKNAPLDGNDLLNTDTLDYRKRAKKYAEKIFKKSDKVVIKDPRICLTLPIWEEAFADAQIKYVYIYRHPSEVTGSLLKRGNISDEKDGFKIWFRYNERALYFLENEEAITVDYNNILTSPLISLLPVYEYLGIDPSNENLSEIYSVVNPKLRNQRSSDDESSLPAEEEKMYELLQSNAESESEDLSFDISRVDDLISLSIAKRDKNEYEVEKELEIQKNYQLEDKKRLQERIDEMDEDIGMYIKRLDDIQSEISAKDAEILDLHEQCENLSAEINSFAVRNAIKTRETMKRNRVTKKIGSTAKKIVSPK